MIGNGVVVSEVESARFGMRIARARLDEDAADGDLGRSLLVNEIDLLILRLPAGAHRLPRALADTGLQVTHADTLVYYSANIADWDAGTVAVPGAVFTVATDAHRGAVADIARQGFSQYRSHYQATPALDPRLVAEGYAEWAASYVSSMDGGRLTYVIEHSTQVVGFVAASLDSGTGVCDVVLNAVLPEFEGRGLYRIALSSLVARAQALGCAKATISTQIWNYRVQRVWTRCGMALSHAYDTYHVSRPPAPAHTAPDVARVALR